jgi:hypothetical protein
MTNREYWRQNADWQLSQMNQIPDDQDQPGGEWRNKSAHFDEYVFALKFLNQVYGESNRIPQTPSWYIPERD